jgi:hypothetical protein
VREPEGIAAPLPGISSKKILVKKARNTRSQRRGRGFESLHLAKRGSANSLLRTSQNPWSRLASPALTSRFLVEGW